MTTIIAWYLALQSFSILGSLLVWRWFPASADRGWAFGKLAGIGAVATALWFGASFGLAAVDQATVAGTLVALSVAVVAVNAGRWSELTILVSSKLRLLLSIEALFLAGLGFWILVRSFAPDAAGTEKPMDLAFFTALSSGGFFPPADPWMSGESISYYYLGYFVWAVPGILAGIAPNLGFNLALATVAAFVPVLAVGVVSAVGPTLSKVGAACAGLALVFMGNLLAFFEMLRAMGFASSDLLRWVDVKGLAPTQAIGIFPADYWWWWRSTRIIDTVVDGRSFDYTITEMPVFSFALGDLHPHVMGLPFLIGAIVIGIRLSRAPVNRPRATDLATAAGLGLFAGSAALVNLWDGPTVFALAFGGWLLPGFITGDRRFSSPGPLMVVGVGAAVALAPFLPFYLNFDTQASGVGIWTGPGSRPLHYLLIWGIFLVPLGVWLWGRARDLTGQRRIWPAALVMAPVAGWVMVELMRFAGAEQPAQAVIARTWPLAPLAALWLTRRSAFNESSAADRAVWMLAGFGLVLQLVSENLFIRDAFGNRMNTVFKAYYQTWPVWGLAAALVAGRWVAVNVGLRLRFVQASAIVLALIGLYYGIGIVAARTVDGSSIRGIDATAFLENTQAGEGEAIEWLRREPAGTLLEAVGGDYSRYGRLSMASGRPTVLGWPGHERQWRGPDPKIDERGRDVAAIYSAETLQEALPLIRKYGVRYIAVGALERATYPAAGLDKLRQLSLGFELSTIAVYVVPDTS